jgi:F420-dependent oxidoreductase-like protein
MKFSVWLPTGVLQDFAGYPDPVRAFETLTELARVAEDTGYDTVWTADHFMPYPAAPGFVFESWLTLAAVARSTHRVRIGQLVTGNGYRNPALQAKMASTLDVVSAGRFRFGIGAGNYDEEYRSYGYQFPDAAQRIHELREAVQIILSMWTNTETTFQGDFYRLRHALNDPKGVQQPHVPLLIGGGGEKGTLRLVAEYGDACNVVASPSELARKYGLLKEHYAHVGRDYNSITLTSMSYCIIGDSDEEARAAIPVWAPVVFPGDIGSYGLIGTPETIRERIAAYADAGVQELVLRFHEPFTTDIVRRFASAFAVTTPKFAVPAMT